MAQSHIGPSPRTVRALEINEKWKIRPVRRCSSNFCHTLGEAGELTTRICSGIDVCTVRLHSVYGPLSIKSITTSDCSAVIACMQWSNIVCCFEMLCKRNLPSQYKMSGNLVLLIELLVLHDSSLPNLVEFEYERSWRNIK